MSDSRDGLKTWANENNINLQEIMPQHPQHGGPGKQHKADQE